MNSCSKMPWLLNRNCLRRTGTTSRLAGPRQGSLERPKKFAKPKEARPLPLTVGPVPGKRLGLGTALERLRSSWQQTKGYFFSGSSKIPLRDAVSSRAKWGRSGAGELRLSRGSYHDAPPPCPARQCEPVITEFKDVNYVKEIECLLKIILSLLKLQYCKHQDNCGLILSSGQDKTVTPMNSKQYGCLQQDHSSEMEGEKAHKAPH